MRSQLKSLAFLICLVLLLEEIIFDFRRDKLILTCFDVLKYN